jgi:hypothetical protein
MFVYLVWQSLGAWFGRAEILQGCAGLGVRRLVEIINVCRSLALGAHPMEILQF